MGDILKDDGLHGENIGKLHLRDVECTDNMGPPCKGDWKMNFKTSQLKL